jgi:hypothetical protein
LLTKEKKKTELTKCRCVPIDRADCIKIANKEATMQYEAYVIENFLSPDECDRVLVAAEAFGFGVTDYPKSYRGNLRLQVCRRLGIHSFLFLFFPFFFLLFFSPYFFALHSVLIL